MAIVNDYFVVLGDMWTGVYDEVSQVLIENDTEAILIEAFKKVNIALICYLGFSATRKIM